MIDLDSMQQYIRDANPIPDLDDIDAAELAQFLASAHAAQPAPTENERYSATTDLFDSGIERRGVSEPGWLRPHPVPRRGLALAAGVAVGVLLIVGATTLLLRSADRGTNPPATTPPPVTTTLPTESTAEKILIPKGYRLQISTVVGALEFVELGTSLGRVAEWFYIPEATPFGVVAVDGDTLWWSTDYLKWDSAVIHDGADRVTVVGNDVVTHGQERAIRWIWTDEGWHEAGQLDIDGAQLISSGRHGTVAVSQDTIFYSSDGQRFQEASGPPDARELALAGEPKERFGGMAGGCSEGIYNLHLAGSEIGTILATADGFVALTAAHHEDWGEPKICEPIPWYSSDGDTWAPVATESPFGDNAVILPKVTERNGRFAAVGSTDGGSAAVWISDDGLSWDRIDLDVEVIDAVAAGELGWIITGVTTLDEAGPQVMFFSTDGISWDGPFDRPEGLASGYLPPQLAVGSDAFFGIGTSLDPVLGRLQAE